MVISLIVAMDENGLIGAGGAMPWHLPGELGHFRRKTLHKAILMGRRTFDAIGKPLTKRDNLVLTRNEDFVAPGARRVADLDEARACARAHRATELVVIGGAQVYALALPRVERMYLTRIHGTFQGDTWFPDMDWTQWQPRDRVHHAADANNPHAYTCMEYRRLREGPSDG